MQYEDFQPLDNLSLLANWEVFLSESGYTSRPASTFWDTVSTKPHKPTIVSRTLQGNPPSPLITRLSLDSTALKTLLIENNGPAIPTILLNTPVLHANRVSAYSRHMGWLIQPNQKWGVEPPNIHPLSLTKAWFQDELTGAWVKLCPKCKKLRSERQYYPRSKHGVPPGRDPYSSVCKKCTKERHQHVKSNLLNTQTRGIHAARRHTRLPANGIRPQ
jgi:hypothetical protein